MPLRLVQITASENKRDRLREVAEKAHALNFSVTECEDGVIRAAALVQPEDRQDFLDGLQEVLEGGDGWRIVVLPVEAAIPNPEESEAWVKARKKRNLEHSREELYNDVAKGAVLDQNFLLMVALSTVVAAVGLAANNVAVLIGAMVIAPLLGPNLAMILATALGDSDLARRSLMTSAAGLGIAVFLGAAIGLLFPVDLDAKELLARTNVAPADIALALASGAAAALSLTTGTSSALVGVMVAVALLPPATTVGVMLGAGLTAKALGALLLLGVNLASVNLAGQIVFLVKGVKPRTWVEKQSAHQSTMLRIALWASSLVILGLVVLFKPF
jgi:uncharacterized hydrophobic protein (TIGR00341 family)